MIPRKWEWIEEQCLKRNFSKAAGIAREIDNVLLECYSSDHTEAWLSFSKTFNFDTLATHSGFIDIVTDPLFCIACMDLEFCVNCRFGKIAGECGDQSSLYRRFLIEIYWVWPKEEKE